MRVREYSVTLATSNQLRQTINIHNIKEVGGVVKDYFLFLPFCL